MNSTPRSRPPAFGVLLLPPHALRFILTCAALVCAALAQTQPPPNDNFVNAQVLTFTQNTGPSTFGMTAAGESENTTATSEPGEPTHVFFSATASSVWFKCTPPSNGSVFVHTAGSVPPTAYAVYSGSTLPALRKLAEYSSTSSAGSPQISVEAGTTYFLAIGSASTTTRGTIAVQVSFLPAPAIAIQPAIRTTEMGENVSFSVATTDTGVSYQWFRNSLAVAGATNAGFTIANAQAADGGSYFVALTNSFGTTASKTAILRGPNPPPSIVTQPASRVVTAGTTATLSVTATGAATTQYQWRRNGFAIPDATAATFTIPTASRSDVDTYDVRVNDGLSVAYSERVRLDVQPAANPQGLGIDPAFNVTLETEGGTVTKLRRAPDGKILVAGNFARYDGATKPNLARLNADGSLDPTFLGAEFNGAITDVAVQPDGRIVVLGSFTQIDGLARVTLARINANGSPDPPLAAAPTFSARTFASVTLQADGKILLAGDFTAASGGLTRSHLVRLHADGSLDTAYNPNPSAAVRSVALQPDGKLLVAGVFTNIGGTARPYLTRLNSDGTNDANFIPGAGPNGATNVLKLAPDGRVLVSGAISQYNGASAPGLLRLNGDGTRDSSFVGSTATGFVFSSGTPPADGSISDLVLLADGSIIIVGSFQFLNGAFGISGSYGFARLKPDGSPDNTFTTDVPIAGGLASVLAFDDGRVLVGGTFGKFTFARQLGGVAAFSAAGKRDPGVGGTFVGGSVSALAPLAGGKLLVAGNFSRVNGVARDSLARLNADGSLDPAFVAAPNDSVSDLAVQGDGRIVITGAFTRVAGTARNGFARLNRDGSLDPAFNTRDITIGTTGAGLRVAALAEGRTLLAANNLGSYIRNRRNLVRFHADGSLDAGFVPYAGSSIGAFTFSSFAVLPDERVLYANQGNIITGVTGKPAVLGRLNQDGRIDPTFTPGTVTDRGGGLDTVTLLPDGKILVGGSFTDFNSTPRSRLARLQPDGTLDTAFAPNTTSTTPVIRLLPALNGAVYVFRGSSFPSPLSPDVPLNVALTRLAPTQQLDASFVLAFTTEFTAFPAALLLDDGNLLLAGGVFRDGSVVRTGLMRTRSLDGVFLLTQPAGTTLTAGANLTLSVTAGGASSFTYQWFKDGVAIPGAERSTYAASSAQASAAGSYVVRITHPGGTLDSTAAIVTINESAPVFASATPTPAGLGSTMKAGTRFALTAPALSAGSAPLSYQWSKDGVALPGETGSALFRPNWSVGDTGAYRVTVTNSRGTIASLPLQQNVAATPDWEWAQPLPQGNPLVQARHLNGRFVVAGARGTILTSPDGTAWSVQRVDTSSNIGPLAFGNGTYVALVQAGGVLTSTDTVTWTPRETGLTDGRGLLQIAFGGDRFVAVGAQGTVITSTDGATWRPATIASSETLGALAFGGGRWLVASATGRVFSSSDGATWSPLSLAPDPVFALAYGAGVFVAVPFANTPNVFTSADGATWTRRTYSTATNAAIAGLQFTDAGFLAVLASSTGNYLFSTDGLSWFEQVSFRAPNAIPTSLTAGGGVLVMTANAPALLGVGGGGFWAYSGRIESRSFRAIATDGSTAIAVGTASANAALVNVSYDGTTWLPRSAGSNAILNDIACGPPPAGIFVAVGNAPGGAGAIVSSPDGTTWTNRAAGLSLPILRGVKFVNGRFLAVGENVLVTSPDGATWTRLALTGSPSLYQVAHGAGVYIAVGAAGTILRSTDATSWSLRGSGATGLLVDVAFAAGKFVAVGATGEIVTSPDGLIWTQRASNAPALASVAFVGGRFLALGSGTSYLESTDGEMWTPAQHGSGLSMADVVEFKNRLVAVGTSGSILTQPLRAPAGSSAPAITRQPAAQIIPIGQNLTLTVAATGTPTPAYQWLKNGTPIAGATIASFTLLSAQFADAGSYTCVVSTPAGAITSSTAALTVTPAVQLSNLSVRTTLAAAQALTVGFTVGGNGGSKWILVRAAGPALTALGVAGAMADPKIELYSRGQKTAENDNWSAGSIETDFARTGAFPFTYGSRDAAWVGPLVDGVSAIASGTGPGALLVECYNTGLALGGPARLTNLSARNRVGSGTDVLIAGLYVSGTGSLRVLVRGAGPALSALGVGGALANPKVELYDALGAKIADNDDWPASLASTFASVGAFAFPAGSRDAALVATLNAPAAFTVQVSGVSGTVGEALVEVYELP